MNIGIDIGGSHLGVGLVDKDRIICKKEKDFSAKDKLEIKEVLEKTITIYIQEILQEYGKDAVEKVGIGSPGFIIDGAIVRPVNLRIDHLNIVQIVKKVIDVPVFMQNDGICAGVAEKLYGNLKPYKNGIFLGLGTGIGGAVFIDSKLNNEKIEIGHTIIQKEGRQCKCGQKGCFESYCSMKALKTQIRNRLNRPIMSSREILEILENEEYSNSLEDILKEYIEYLAIGISNLVNLFEADVVVIGGSFVYYQEVLLERLLQELQEKTLSARVLKKAEIKLASMGNEAGMIGAANLSLLE